VVRIFFVLAALLHHYICTCIRKRKQERGLLNRHLPRIRHCGTWLFLTHSSAYQRCENEKRLCIHHSLSKYHDCWETKQKRLCCFCSSYVNLCTVTVILNSLYFHIIKRLSNRDSWVVTSNREEYIIFNEFGQRICARWSTVQYETKGFCCVALKFTELPNNMISW
jgi:hypothetical protein